MTTNQIVKIIILSVLVLFMGLPLVFGSWFIVSPQEVGIVTRLGSISRVVSSGFHAKLPYLESVTTLDTMTIALPVNESTYSKDGQVVDAQATVSYSIVKSNAESIYKEFKDDYETRLVIPAIKESIKNIFSGYTAQGLIDNRAKLASEINGQLNSKLQNNLIMISSVAITNIDFDDQYESAIRNKQIAEQRALEQANVTKQEEEKKKQEILKAEAMAEKTRLEVKALENGNSGKIVEKIYAEATLEAAKKWDGKLPTQMVPGSAVPFINLTK